MALFMRRYWQCPPSFAFPQLRYSSCQPALNPRQTGQAPTIPLHPRPAAGPPTGRRTGQQSSESRIRRRQSRKARGAPTRLSVGPPLLETGRAVGRATTSRTARRPPILLRYSESSVKSPTPRMRTTASTALHRRANSGCRARSRCQTASAGWSTFWISETMPVSRPPMTRSE